MGYVRRFHGHVRRIHGPQAAGSMGHVRRLHGPRATAPWATGGWQAAVHVHHDTVVSRRRRRHATAASRDFFCVPFGGGAPTGASLHLRPPLRRRRPRREYADCTYVSDCCAVCGPRVRACRGCRPRWRSAPRTALQRSRTPLTAIATAAALAPSTWVDSAGRSRFSVARFSPWFSLGAHLAPRRANGRPRSHADCDDGGPARSSNRLIAPTAPTARTLRPAHDDVDDALAPWLALPRGRMLVIICCKSRLFRVAPYMNKHE